MRVLLYIDPLIEREKPYWKDWWVAHPGAHIISSLNRAGINNNQLAIIVNEALLERTQQRFPDIHIATIEHNLFVPGLSDSSLSSAIFRYRNTAPAEGVSVLGTRIRERLRGFVPDIAISWSPCPELLEAWPNMPILYTEYGMFSRAPYPETLYLDPYGMFQNSAPYRLYKTILERSVEQSELDLLEEIRKYYRPFIFDASNPLSSLITPYKKEFARLALLSLQFSDFYAYNAHARFSSQYDFLIYTLDNIPPEIGVIVTEHPEHPILDEGTFSFLQEKYNNLIWHEEFRELRGVSQYALAFVDSVITVSSSVAYHAALWRKKVIILGSSHFDIFADSHDLTVISDSNEPRDNETLLAWLLSRYFIPWKILFEGTILRELLEKRLNLSQELSLGEFPRPAYFDNLLMAYCDNREDIHKSITSDDTPASKESLSYIRASFYLAELAEPYSEDRRIQFEIKPDAALTPTRITLHEKFHRIFRLRFDPTDKPDLLCIHAFRFLDENGEILDVWRGNSPGVKSDSLKIISQETIYCDVRIVILSNDYDPWIELEVPSGTVAVEIAIERLSTDTLVILQQVQATAQAQTTALISEMKKLRRTNSINPKASGNLKR